MRASVFFSILRSRWTAHRSGEDFVKFGDRLDKQVENSGNPSTSGEYQKKFLENWRIFWIFPTFLLWGLHSHFFFCRRLANFRQKKKTHCSERLVSTWNTKCQKSTDRPYSPTPYTLSVHQDSDFLGNIFGS